MKRLFQVVLLLAPVMLWAQSRPGSISGRIVTVKGEPAVGVRISAMTAPQSQATASSALTALVSLAQTDATGRYRLENVPPGRYLVTAGLLDVPTYYPGVFATEKAAVVSVPAGGSVTEIDFAMPPSVSGRLQSARPDRARGVSMELVNENRDVRLQATTKTDGSFRFDAVPPGTYSLAVANRPLAEPVTISVTDYDITGLEFGLLENVTIGGALVVDGGGLRPLVTLSLSPLQPRLCSWMYRATASSGTDPGCTVTATFDDPRIGARSVADLVEGEYRVALNPLPPGYFLKSIVSGDVDLVTHPFHTKWRAQPIIVTLGVDSPPPWVQVSGHVRNEGPTSIARPGKVSLLPSRRAPSPLTYLVDSLDAEVKGDGSFEFPMVSPGAYEVGLGKLPVPTIYLTVTDRDLRNVDIVIPPLQEIAGRVSIDGVNSIVDEAHLTFALSGPALAENIFTTAEIQCGRNFRAVFPQGNFSVTVTELGVPVKSVTYGDVDVLKNPLKIAPGDREDLRVVLTGPSRGIGELREVCNLFQFVTPSLLTLPLLPIPELPPLTPPPPSATESPSVPLK